MRAGPVIHVLSGDLIGGKEVQIELQVLALMDRGTSAAVLLLERGAVERRYRSRGIPCAALADVPTRTGLFRRSLETVHRISQGHSPRCIIAHGYKESVVAAFLARHLRSPLIIVYHGRTEALAGWPRFKLSFYQSFMNLLSVAVAAKTVYVTSALLPKWRRGSRRVTVIRNVVAPPHEDSPENAHPSTVFGSDGETPMPELHRPALVMVGRLVPVKRFDIAIEALRILIAENGGSLPGRPLPSISIVGNGPEEAVLRELVRRLALERQVHFLGFHERAAEIIGRADVFLLTSESEGIPTVLLEALVRGVPVVTTQVGGIPEVLDLLPDYPARQVPAFAPRETASAIAELLAANGEGSARAPESIRNRARDLFSPAGAATAWEAVIDECQ